MLEIIFKGKRTDKNEWVYGDIIHGVGAKEGNIFILPIVKNLAYLEGCDPLDGYKVIPNTVCQFTGLRDKNNKKIFDGDFLREIETGIIVQIHCDEFGTRFVHNGHGYYFPNHTEKFEVIGNVYDNLN